MKNLLYLFFLLVLVASCKPTNSAIITSKKTAIKKNKYDYNAKNRIAKLEQKIKDQKEKILIRKEKDRLAILAEIEKDKKKEEESFLNEENDKEIKISLDNGSYLNDQLVYNAIDNIGSPYVTGGLSKSGFDCSGLVYTTYKNFGYTLPRTSIEMSRFGRVLNINEYRKGDLIFFRTLGSKVINHVGMIVEVSEDEIKFIHASIKKGVIISSTKKGYYKDSFAQVNRVLE